MKNALIRTGLVLMVVMLIAIYVLDCEAASNNKTNRIRFGYVVAEYSGAILLAKEFDFFTRAGVHVQFKEYPSGFAAIQDLIKGELDLATSTETVFASASLNNPDLRLIASINRFSNLKLIMTKQSGFKGLEDIREKRIGLHPGTQSEVDFQRHLALNLIPESAVKKVAILPENMGPAIESGQVDGVAIWSPVSLMIEKKFGEKVISLPTEHQKHYWVIVTSERFLSNNRDQVNMILRALVQAESFSEKYPEQTKVTIAKALGFSMQDLEKIWPSHEILVELNQSILIEIEDQARFFLAKNGEAGKTIPNFLNYIDTEPLKKVKPDSVWLTK